MQLVADAPPPASTTIPATREECPSRQLRVLLLCEQQQHSSDDASALLRACHHDVSHTQHVQEAIQQLQQGGDSSSSSGHFDVALANIRALGGLDPWGSGIFQAAADAGTPLVLMADEQCSASDVMAAVQAGAADVLERPLSQTKLQTLWQHAIRASMTISSKSTAAAAACTSPRGDCHMQQQQQQQLQQDDNSKQQHHLLPPSPAPATCPPQPTNNKLSSPMCFGLLDDGLMDGLGGLELPPLVPSQLEFFDSDLLLISDLQAAADPAAAAAAAASLDGAAAPLDDLLLLQPASPSSHSNAATAVAASLFGGGGGGGSSSSDQQYSGNTHFNAASAGMELESSCADASSGGSPLPARRKLRACTGLRSMAAAANSQAAGQAPMDCCAEQAHGLSPGGLGMAPMAAGMPGASQWGGAAGYLGGGMGAAPLPGPLGSGMVWGMPVYNVAVAPGIVPPQQQPATGSSTVGTAVAGHNAGSRSCSSAAVDGAVCLQQSSQGARPHRHAAAVPAAVAAGQQQGCCPTTMPQKPQMWPAMWGGMCFPMCYPMWSQNPVWQQQNPSMMTMMPQYPAVNGLKRPLVAAPAAAMPGMAPLQLATGSSGVPQEQQ